MQRVFRISALAAALYCFAVAAPATAANCLSVQAKCAVEIGGTCDMQSGHWCYGHYQHQACGGTSRAFLACLDRNGKRHVSAPESVGPRATADNPGKCTSVQARCIIEAGGYCDPNSGHWRLGHVYQHFYGGNQQTFFACLDRARGALR